VRPSSAKDARLAPAPGARTVGIDAGQVAHGDLPVPAVKPRDDAADTGADGADKAHGQQAHDPK
jgi:hypothetical protein